MRIFWKKFVKSTAASEAPPPNPRWPPTEPPDLALQLPLLNVFSIKQQLFCFCTYYLFSLQTLQFCWSVRKNIFLLGAGYPSYATGKLSLCLSIQRISNTLFS